MPIFNSNSDVYYYCVVVQFALEHLSVWVQCANIVPKDVHIQYIWNESIAMEDTNDDRHYVKRGLLEAPDKNVIIANALLQRLEKHILLVGTRWING